MRALHNFRCRFAGHCCTGSTRSAPSRVTPSESENLLDGRDACPIPRRFARNHRQVLATACQSHKNRFPVSRLRVLSPTYGEVPGGLWRRQNCAENSTGGVRRQCYVLSERLPGDSSGVEYHSGLTSESGGNAAWGRKNRHILKALPNATRKPQLMSLRFRDRSSGSTRPRVMGSLFQTKIIFQTFYFT
jgi:hypothetical protein